jgi:hypothetical protein
MPTLAEFVRAELGRLHRGLDGCAADITPEALHAVPGGSPRANTVAFGLWHITRTEDNVVRFVIQNRRPTVWQEGGYAERLGLPPVAQGTGMPTAEAQALRIRDLDLFREYMGRVWASTEELFEQARRDPAALERTVTVKPIGDMPAIQALGQICLTHGMAHFGELELARTLLGLTPVIGF